MTDHSFQIGDVVRCQNITGPQIGRVTALPGKDNLYRVDLGDIPDSDGEVEYGCFYRAEGQELELVRAATAEEPG